MLAEANTITTARSDVIAALHQASAVTGSDFNYLLDTAMRESSLKPQAKSTSSSASGLFQFVGQTWLGLVKQHGAKYGLGAEADAIQQGSDGRFHAATPAAQQAILALRNDPKIASLMEGEFANQTKSALESGLGRGVCNGELYAAHFLGPDAACRLIQLSDAQPGANAAAAFPQAANANRSVFYHQDGSAKTVREVYQWATKQDVSHAATPTKIAATHAHNTASSANQPDTNWLAFQMLDGGDSFSSLPQSPLAPGILNILAALTPFEAQDDQTH
ncbi:MAG TPA: hypothetical protein VGT78_09530 [Rhizomicrobium sp.]|nr:hypothetical protein [Rhizomicrobium sp.]